LPHVTLPALDGGKPLELAGLSGVPTVINVWASWCGPCKAELPLFAKAHRELGGNVRVLGIDFADPAPDSARQLAATAGATFPSYVDPKSTIRADLKVIGLPQTVFVDGRGTIVATERRAFRSYADLSEALVEHLGVKP
jgi:thiol-disulfide isomerase/thioredoxin